MFLFVTLLILVLEVLKFNQLWIFAILISLYNFILICGVVLELFWSHIHTARQGQKQ